MKMFSLIILAGVLGVTSNAFGKTINGLACKISQGMKSPETELQAPMKDNRADIETENELVKAHAYLVMYKNLGKAIMVTRIQDKNSGVTAVNESDLKAERSSINMVIPSKSGQEQSIYFSCIRY